MGGTYSVGLDLGTATTSTSAIRIKEGANIAFDVTSLARLRHDNGAVPGLVYSYNGVDKVLFSDSGNVVLGKTISWTNTYTSTSATAGTNGAPPAQVAGYIIVNIAGVDVKVPYYST
jgi:hypothetical protein